MSLLAASQNPSTMRGKWFCALMSIVVQFGVCAQTIAQDDRASSSVVVESVEADVSTRRVAVTSAFTGSEIIVFGSVVNGQHSAFPGYDVIVIVDGTAAPLIARRKSNVAGIWINTESVSFKSLPSYYAITSTRPISQIAPRAVLKAEGIGFAHIGMVHTPSDSTEMSAKEFTEFRDAVVRLKQRDNLYQQADAGVTFIGKNLFRTSIELPANVPVGNLTTRVYLFRGGKLLARHDSNVSLDREGLEYFLHTFAFRYPTYYGIFAVILAVAAGLLASVVFPRRN
ncbi:MAG: TIGR02186 family protein [Hyphomicrobiaceae bacterium]